MVPVTRGDSVVDVCPTCRGIWFDPEEMVLLQDDDLTAGEDEDEGEGSKNGPVLLRSKRGLICPACRLTLAPVDYQYTGSVVYHCGECGGTFTPRNSIRNIHRRLVAGKEKADKIFRNTGQRVEEERGFAGLSRKSGGDHFFLPIPAVIPVESEVKLGIIPYVTLSLIILFLFFLVSGLALLGGPEKVAETVALASGGRLGTPMRILGYGLFHTHLLPLVVNCAFLFIAGSPLEERLSPAKYILLFFAGLIACGMTHLSAADPGEMILGAAGGTSSILGSYVVLFPLVRVRVLAMGYFLSLPSYLMVIAWLLISFFMTGDFISAYVNPYGPGFVPVSAAFFTGLLVTAGLKMIASES